MGSDIAALLKMVEQCDIHNMTVRSLEEAVTNNHLNIVQFGSRW